MELKREIGLIAISVIIPVLNEVQAISRLLPYLRSQSGLGRSIEFIIVDGGSTDGSRQKAIALGAKVVSSPKGRAVQMNCGANYAEGNVLYFLHVDTFPPKQFGAHIVKAVGKGSSTGCFQLRFDSESRFLGFFAWFTRFNHPLCRGGDQSLFITRKLFNLTKGFDEAFTVYEDNEFIGRLYRMGRFSILPQSVTTSARRYEERGKWALQFHFGMIHLIRFLGGGPEDLKRYYFRKVLLEPIAHNQVRPLH